MAALTFNALEFESQSIPAQLPQLAPDPFPADCCLTADQKSDLGKNSALVGIMDTPAKVIQHWRLVLADRAQRAAQVAAKEAKDARYNPVKRLQANQAKLAHAAVVNEANNAWREAIAQRKAALEQWDAFVKQKHDEFTRLKTMKVV